MYSKIINPETGRKVSVKGKLGKQILNNYLVNMNGGSGSKASALTYSIGTIIDTKTGKIVKYTFDSGGHLKIHLTNTQILSAFVVGELLRLENTGKQTVKHLSFEEVDGTVPIFPCDDLPREIYNFTGLKILDLSNQHLSSIPDGIQNLTKLEKLYLNNNPIDNLPHNDINSMTTLKIIKVSPPTTGYPLSYVVNIMGPIPQLHKLQLLTRRIIL